MSKEQKDLYEYLIKAGYSQEQAIKELEKYQVSLANTLCVM